MAMLDSFIDQFVQPKYRPYFRATYGGTADDSTAAPQSSSAPGFDGSMPQQAPAPFTDPLSGAPMAGPPVDPYAPANAAIEARKASTMAPGKPILGAGLLSDMGVLQQPGSAPLAPGSAAPALPAPIDVRAPDPVADAGLPLGAKPAMQPGPAAAPVAPATPPPAASPGAGFLSRISDALASHPSTLLAMGAGFAGAPSFGQGMSRAFGAAVPASKQDQALGIQQQGIAASYKALVAAGVSPQEALAASYNPEIMKALTQRTFGMNAHWGIVGYDQMGQSKYGFINDALQTAVPADKVRTPQVSSPEEVLRLPKGQHFIGWDGQEHVR